jgi:hypothetical protein
MSGMTKLPLQTKSHKTRLAPDGKAMTVLCCAKRLNDQRLLLGAPVARPGNASATLQAAPIAETAEQAPDASGEK